jgi:hypothetical protein
VNLPSASIFLVCAFVSIGCDLFQTRDPQSPNQAASTFRPPDTPEILRDNFASAVQEHNVTNYMRCFVDTSATTQRFVFSPSAGYETVFQTWKLDDEQRYFQNLGDPAGSVPILTFSNAQELNRTSGTAEFTMEYFLFYPHRRADVSQQVKGFMHLYVMVDSRQQWVINRWEDTKTTSDSTWSYLKAHF